MCSSFFFFAAAAHAVTSSFLISLFYIFRHFSQHPYQFRMCFYQFFFCFPVPFFVVCAFFNIIVSVFVFFPSFCTISTVFMKKGCDGITLHLIDVKQPSQGLTALAAFTSLTWLFGVDRLEKHKKECRYTEKGSAALSTEIASIGLCQP